MPGEEALHGLLRCLLRMKDRIRSEWRYGSQLVGGGLEVHVRLGEARLASASRMGSRGMQQLPFTHDSAGKYASWR